uniref:SH3 domain-containing protein n=1 Tax=Dicentrarchus labrax TaxID=13489 RepID=A0A8C4EK32_DICLA
IGPIFRHRFSCCFVSFRCVKVLVNYWSLYTFQSAELNSLHFAAGESFLMLERSDKNWWLESHCNLGETSSIPASYIKEILFVSLNSSSVIFKKVSDIF